MEGGKEGSAGAEHADDGPNALQSGIAEDLVDRLSDIHVVSLSIEIFFFFSRTDIDRCDQMLPVMKRIKY